MRRTGRASIRQAATHRGGRTVLVLVAVLMAATAAAGCGTVAAPGQSPVASRSRAASAPAATSPAATPSAGSPGHICVSSAHPLAAARMSANIARALAGRPESIAGLAAWDPALGVSCALRADDHFYSASVIKVTILSALLHKIGGVGHLTDAQRSLAHAMITQSDNNAATALWDEVGMTSMQNLLDLAGMTNTVLSTAWGLTRITPADELKLLHLISIPGPVLGQYAREYILSLMAAVEPGQRWGVSAGTSTAVTVHIKNGWLDYPDSADWNINSLGIFTAANVNYQMAVLTAPTDPKTTGQTEGYGIQTVQQVAGIINRNIIGLHKIFR